MEFWGNSYLFGEKDPHFPNVSLLLAGNGANGSTSIIDSSPSPKTVSVFNQAQISTAILDPFGRNAGVLKFDGSVPLPDYLTVPGSSAFAFGTGDFTVEGFFYETARRPFTAVFEVGRHTTDAGFVCLTSNAATTPKDEMLIYANGFIPQGLSTGPLNAWNFLVYQRKNGIFQCFANGIGGPTSNVSKNFSNTGPVTIGNQQTFSIDNTSYPYTGYMSQLRVTQGIARYAANFVPPTAPFPTS